RRLFRELPARGSYNCTLAFILPASVLLSSRIPGLVDRSWIFDYQEPISPQNKRTVRRSPIQRLLQSRLRELERTTLHRAGKVVFTSESNRSAYINAGLVQEGISAHVPYFYDADLFAQDVEPTDTEFGIVYFGTFDSRGARSPKTFLRALARFLQELPEARPRTRFHFFGNWIPSHNRWVDDLKLHDVVSFHAPVDYAEYLLKLRQYSVLLLVVSSAHNLFMPSKIVDYFGANRPILAFVPPQSEMRRVLERAGMNEYACDEFDIGEGASTLRRLWAQHIAGNLILPSERTKFWSSETQLPRYLEFLTSL
ncbi:MAG: hypothetical protein ACWGQW_15905, partial [bacterium]